MVDIATAQKRPLTRGQARLLAFTAGATVANLYYAQPLLPTIATSLHVSQTSAALLVTLTLPEHLEAGHVDFARQLAAKAWAYAVAVERRYRGLPALPDQPVPPLLTARADTWTSDPARLEAADLADCQEVTA